MPTLPAVSRGRYAETKVRLQFAVNRAENAESEVKKLKRRVAELEAALADRHCVAIAELAQANTELLAKLSDAADEIRCLKANTDRPVLTAPAKFGDERHQVLRLQAVIATSEAVRHRLHEENDGLNKQLTAALGGRI